MNAILTFILIFGAAIGLALVGIALRMMRLEREKKEKEKEGEKEAAASTPPPESPTPTITPAVTPSIPTLSRSPAPAPTAPSQRPELVAGETEEPMLELARLLRAPDGRLIVEVDGSRYQHRLDITDANIGRRLLIALDDFYKFLRTDQPRPATPIPSASAAAVSPPPPAPPKTPTLIDGKPTIVLTTQEAAQLPLVKPSMNVIDQWNLLREKEKQPEIKIKSVLEEIDDLLQERAVGTPFAGRGLHVKAGPTGSALFSIDGKNYEGVEQLPDPALRAFVQSVIKEWEKK